ncbi:MAG: TlpA family protein disulfide reductase [Candidatus Rokubacteria bacterium]|nr:TlpA family protein disulfide reductase [Candidatus Rokubacteria bacterium]
MPSTIEQMHKEFGPRGLAVLAVNIQESRGVVAAWVKEKGITSRVLLDIDGSVTAAYRVTATPTVVLVARDGKLVGRAIGTRGWTSDAGRALLEALLQPAGR